MYTEQSHENSRKKQERLPTSFRGNKHFSLRFLVSFTCICAQEIVEKENLTLHQTRLPDNRSNFYRKKIYEADFSSADPERERLGDDFRKSRTFSAPGWIYFGNEDTTDSGCAVSLAEKSQVSAKYTVVQLELMPGQWARMALLPKFFYGPITVHRTWVPSE